MTPRPLTKTSDSARSTSLSIFLLETHADTATCLKDYLERMGHSIECATTHEEAAQALQVGRFDVVIADVSLANTWGLEILDEPSSSPRPVYTVAMSTARQRTATTAFRRHLLKPFSPDDIDLIIDAIVQERRAH
jgi:CheY-like chemotaxis protein